MNSISRQGNPDVRAAAGERLASLRRFLDADPDNARLRRDVVTTAVAAGEFEYLRGLAEDRLASVPTDAEAQFDRATALIGLNDFAAALPVLQSLDASIPGVRLDIGLCLYFLGQYAEAKPHLQGAYEAGDRSAQTLRLLLLTLHHLGAFDDIGAMVSANESVFSGDPQLAGLMSVACLDSGESARARHWANVALAADPDNADALTTDGTLRAVALDAQGAKLAFKRAVTMRPQSGRAWLGLGTGSMLSGDFATATGQLERAVEFMPKHLGSWHSLAWAHLFGGRIDAAERVFKHVFELDRTFSESHGGLAIIAASRGDRAAAERHIEVAERLDADCNNAKFARAVLAGLGGGPEAFRADLMDSLKSIPGRGRLFEEMLGRANRTRKPPPH
jgi:tetratricopeptide (TPR) repeat protein